MKCEHNKHIYVVHSLVSPPWGDDGSELELIGCVECAENFEVLDGDDECDLRTIKRIREGR